MVARRVVYSGSVQGVGFRATAVRLAARFAVTGWVRNLPDSRVELWAEGPVAEMTEFLAAVREYWGTAIEAVQEESRPSSGPHTGFTIVR